MEENKISVIIPCYNVEKYLEEAVQSVLNQTYKNIEVILVDDGSTDKTSAICDRYVKEYTSVRVIHQVNSGQACARNVGMEYATGEYIYFMDSDDWIDKSTLSSVLENMVVHNADIAFFDAYVVDEYGGMVNDCRYIKNELDETVRTGVEWYRIMIDMSNFSACVPYHVFKKEFLLENRLKFFPGIIHEDELFLYEAYLKAKSVLRNRGVYYYRRLRSGSTMMGPNNFYRFYSLQTILNVALEQYTKCDCSKSEFENLMLFMKRIECEMIIQYSKMILVERKKKFKELRRSLKEYGKIVLRHGRRKDFMILLKHCYYIFRINH